MKQTKTIKKIFFAVLIFQFAFFQFFPLKVQAASHTDTSQEDFNLGYSQSTSLNDMVQSAGSVSLSKIFNYSSTSDPAIAGGYVAQSWLDAATHYLYVSTSGGLSVIDTQGTSDTSDDTLVITYSTSTDSTPAIADNYVWHSWLDATTHYLYVSTDGGLSVIDTHETSDPSDDTLVITYSTSTDSTPAIASNGVTHSWLDATTHYLYVSTDGGLSVIDTQGTSDTSDDTLVITYSTSTDSTPAIASDYVWQSWLDATTHYLYVSTYGGGLSVIDTRETLNPSDDTLVITYSTASTPAIADNYVTHSWLDAATHYLYVSTGGGLSVIDTHETSDPSDDTLVITYSTASTPAIADNYAEHSWLDTATHYLYVSTDGGLSVIKPNYNYQGIYFSHPITTSSTPASVISWEATAPDNTAVAIQTRAGDSTVYWRDNFDDGNTSNVSDMGWDGTFSATEANGILTINNASTNDIYAAIDTGKGEDYFPAGSVVQARIKMTTDENDYTVYMFTDDFEDGSQFSHIKNEWVTITLIPTLPFSTVDIEPYLFDPANPNDKLEIDWISVTSASGWGDWSDSYVNSNGSVITSDTAQPYLQYKATLSTTDTAVTPTLDSVTIGDTAASDVVVAEEQLATSDVVVAEEQSAEKAEITSWKAYEYQKPDLSCQQRLKLEIKGKHFAKNAEVRIGNKEAFSVNRKSSQEITAKFCLEKLINVKTDLKRTVSVTNPDADTEKAKKKIDLANLSYESISTASSSGDFNMQTTEGIKNIQTALVKLGLLDQQYITGFYGPLTTEAVRKFQEQNGIDQTGTVGTITRAKLVEKMK